MHVPFEYNFINQFAINFRFAIFHQDFSVNNTCMLSLSHKQQNKKLYSYSLVVFCGSRIEGPNFGFLHLHTADRSMYFASRSEALSFRMLYLYDICQIDLMKAFPFNVVHNGVEPSLCSYQVVDLNRPFGENVSCFSTARNVRGAEFSQKLLYSNYAKTWNSKNPRYGWKNTSK